MVLPPAPPSILRRPGSIIRGSDVQDPPSNIVTKDPVVGADGRVRVNETREVSARRKSPPLAV